MDFVGLYHAHWTSQCLWYAWYVQGGPSIVAADGEENETRYSGKVGASVALSSSVGVYGELSALTADDSLDLDDLGVGGKLGVKYSF